MAINNFNVGVGTTSQLTRYRYVATGGETSISGTDADGKTLSYTVGLEQVFLNGVNLVRGQDYTATNGTSIGNLTALVASDSLEVFAYVPFNIANALTVSTVDAKGDLLVGTGADAVGRLAVGATNNQLLAVDSSTATGLKWANPGLTLIKTQSFSAVASSSVDDVFSATYDNYKILITGISTDGPNLAARLRVGGADNSTASSYVHQTLLANSTTINGARVTDSQWLFGNINLTTVNGYSIDLFDPFKASATSFSSLLSRSSSGGFIHVHAGTHNQTVSYTGFTLIATAGTITGSVSVYGYNK